MTDDDNNACVTIRPELGHHTELSDVVEPFEMRAPALHDA